MEQIKNASSGSRLIHLFANVLLVLIIYNYYMKYEYGHYACSLYTHIFGFVLPLLAVLFLWFSPKVTSLPLVCLKAIVFTLAYSMFWFHFMYDLDVRRLL